ncbi:MAG: exodeoxyribonuclease V subunit alpha [Chitinophagaceae bacterium]|nr:exodeoxyribonuclease V subunit alpha [Chitinophagaceae bacterium]
MPVLTENFDKTSFQFAEYFPEYIRPYFYTLWAKLKDGHICVKENEVTSADWSALFPNYKPKEDLSEFISENDTHTPIIESAGNLYLQRYFKYETTIIRKIHSLIKTEVNPVLSSDTTRLYNALYPSDEETDWQAVATAAALIQSFCIITGGPGTGKTRTVSNILALLLTENPDLKIALAAPTGKAAARMTESIKNNAAHYPEKIRQTFDSLSPSTIHRLLIPIKDSIYFKHQKGNPLPYDVIIIDESSMIDVALFAKLLDAIPESARLILLGDKNQLASVEAGSLFGDLCSLPEALNQFSKEFIGRVSALYNRPLPSLNAPVPLSDHIVELQKSYRFDDNRGIGKLSRIVINEDVKGFETFMRDKDDIVTIDFTYDAHLFHQLIDKFELFIREPDIPTAIKLMNKCRVLCATRFGRFGLYQTNKRIEAYLEKKGLIRCNRLYYENRPIIITQNNYELKVYNGDTGIIRTNSEGIKKAFVETESGIAEINPVLLNYADTSFAITIHKSQGSEFDDIAVMLPEHDAPILTKELVYTAITRAKKRVLLQSAAQVLKDAMQRRVQRGSGLHNRFDP